MSTHTPGPWTAVANEWDKVLPEKDRGHDWYIVAANEDVVALRLPEPNARLIAAAPDLLAACEAIVGVFEGFEPVPLYVSKARAAIAKAEETS